MFSKKYTKDYRLEPSMNARGRLTDETIYCGAYYDFRAAPAQRKKSAAVLLVQTLLAVATMSVPLFSNGDYARKFYLFLPLALLLVPCYLLILALVRLRTYRPPLTRKQSDLLAGRARFGALLLLLFGAAGAVASTVYYFLEAPRGLDALACALSIVRLADGIWAFSTRRAFEMVALDPPSKSEEGASS